MNTAGSSEKHKRMKSEYLLDLVFIPRSPQSDSMLMLQHKLTTGLSFDSPLRQYIKQTSQIYMKLVIFISSLVGIKNKSTLKYMVIEK